MRHDNKSVIPCKAMHTYENRRREMWELHEAKQYLLVARVEASTFCSLHIDLISIEHCVQWLLVFMCAQCPSCRQFRMDKCIYSFIYIYFLLVFPFLPSSLTLSLWVYSHSRTQERTTRCDCIADAPNYLPDIIAYCFAYCGYEFNGEVWLVCWAHS